MAPLSALIASLFDKMEHGEVLTALQLLGSNKIDNYGEEFITKLYENFSQR